MGLLFQRVERNKVAAGDHIYTWRSLYAYTHHGIYAGGNLVVHFTREQNIGSSEESSGTSSVPTLSFPFSSSASVSKFPPTTCPNIASCGFRQPESGVILSCLDCFLLTGSLYLFEYGVSPSIFIAKFRGGTCTTANSDPPQEVIHRAMHLLQNGFGNYDVFRNNCEDFALYCKTGLLVDDRTGLGMSGQAACMIGFPMAAILSSPLKLFTSSPIGVVMATAGMYCMSRYATDIGVRSDAVKVRVEDMVVFNGLYEPIEAAMDDELCEGEITRDQVDDSGRTFERSGTEKEREEFQTKFLQSVQRRALPSLLSSSTAMDGEGIPIAVTTTTTATTCLSLPPHGPDFSHVGSPELSDNVAPAGDDLQSSQTVVLTDELRDRIIKQVEYNFSDENLKTDNFLMKHITKDEEGFVTVSVIASFRKMKKLTRDESLILAALKESHLLVISSDDKKVKRLHPISSRDHELCTVLVENLPNDHSTENIQRIFGEAGKIMKITIRDPTIDVEPRKHGIQERLLCGKLHAYVEYETIEAAEKAVTTLNNEQDWRYGMRVKLLKRKGKNVQKKNKPESEKSGNIQAPDPPAYEEKNHANEQHDDTPNEEIEEHSVKEKHGYKGRRGGRERRQKYHGYIGHGHGTFPINHAGKISKPPPGPRIPDGTRGFAMGRGRPLTTNQN